MTETQKKMIDTYIEKDEMGTPDMAPTKEDLENPIPLLKEIPLKKNSVPKAVSWSTFWDTAPKDFLSSPKRFVPGSKSRRINTFHLSPIKVKVVSTGQAGNSLTDFCSLIISSPIYRSYQKLCIKLYHTASK